MINEAIFALEDGVATAEKSISPWWKARTIPSVPWPWRTASVWIRYRQAERCCIKIWVIPSFVLAPLLRKYVERAGSAGKAGTGSINGEQPAMQIP